jgi:hypothetical protein
MQTSDLVQRVHVCANTFRHQHSSIIKNSQIYIYINIFKIDASCARTATKCQILPSIAVWSLLYGYENMVQAVSFCRSKYVKFRNKKIWGCLKIGDFPKIQWFIMVYQYLKLKP